MNAGGISTTEDADASGRRGIRNFGDCIVFFRDEASAFDKLESLLGSDDPACLQ